MRAVRARHGVGKRPVRYAHLEMVLVSDSDWVALDTVVRLEGSSGSRRGRTSNSRSTAGARVSPARSSRDALLRPTPFALPTSGHQELLLQGGMRMKGGAWIASAARR